MTSRHRLAAVLVAGGLSVTGLTAVAPVAAQASGIYDNCTALHHRWPHGDGRKHAHDHTSGTPVTSFKHSTRLYNRAMFFNAGLDGDKDGIACEAA
jgi:hypothetical protein